MRNSSHQLPMVNGYGGNAESFEPGLSNGITKENAQLNFLVTKMRTIWSDIALKGAVDFDDLERVFYDLRVFVKEEAVSDLHWLRKSGVILDITNIVTAVNNETGKPKLPIRTIYHGLQVLLHSARSNNNKEYLLLNEHELLISLLELLHRLLTTCTPPSSDSNLLAASSIFALTSDLLLYIPSKDKFELIGQTKDHVVGYITAIEIVESIKSIFSVIHGPLSTNSPLLTFVEMGMKFLESAVEFPQTGLVIWFTRCH
ncbi:hypothetical protein BKA69DRAFT_159875 [Paraphysoderma sedebokerense]|nr:hypothetical protein BKA69DRAFT_159875 [Paraphysoderma sedebokerense]